MNAREDQGRPFLDCEITVETRDGKAFKRFYDPDTRSLISVAV